MSSNDAADELNIKPLPIPSEQRMDVFVATPSSELEECWLRHGGKSLFHHPPTLRDATWPGKRQPSEFCGIALFRLTLSYNIPREVWALLEPFFARAGAESNVFEFDPVRQNFTRRDAAWFEGRVGFDERRSV